MLAVLAAQISVAHSARADTQAVIDDLKCDQPSEVAAYIDRRVGCNYWSSEPPYDAERAAEIKKVLGDLKCQALTDDERSLRARFAASPNVLKALDEARDLTY
jgi:hypothetical protein